MFYNLLWTQLLMLLLLFVSCWSQGLSLPRKNYGRCTSEFNDVAFCRLLSDCAIFSSEELNDEKFRSAQKCVMEQNINGLICCPIARKEEIKAAERCKTTTGEFGYCRTSDECPSNANLEELIEIIFGPDSGICKEGKICCPLEKSIKLTARDESSICGLQLTDRVFGGTETLIGEYPWMALIEMETYTGKEFKCGGTLISDNWVITAAHCVQRHVPITGVRLGEWSTLTNPDCVRPNDCADLHLDIAVNRVITHPDYRASGIFPHDIALLRLATTVVFTKYIKPICLPVDTQPQHIMLENINATIAGWGVTETGAVSTEKLQGKLRTINLGTCRERLGTRYNSIDSWKLCAFGYGNVSSCHGDSGGPVMYDQKGYFLVGIISLGTANCASKSLPMMLTRVKPYIPWIEETMSYEQ